MRETSAVFDKVNGDPTVSFRDKGRGMGRDLLVAVLGVCANGDDPLYSLAIGLKHIVEELDLSECKEPDAFKDVLSEISKFAASDEVKELASEPTGFSLVEYCIGWVEASRDMLKQGEAQSSSLPRPGSV